MTYDETLAARVRTALADHPGLSEKRMFGGLCFLLHSNMCCGIVDDTLMVRLGPDAYEPALARPHAREMDFTGRPLPGMVYVAPAGVRTATALASWVRRGTAFAASLPCKKARAKKKRRA